VAVRDRSPPHVRDRCTPQAALEGDGEREKERERERERERAHAIGFGRRGEGAGAAGGQGGRNGRFTVLACQGVVSLAGNDDDRVGGLQFMCGLSCQARVCALNTGARLKFIVKLAGEGDAIRDRESSFGCGAPPTAGPLAIG